MNKQSLLGFVLIGIILIGFSQYNTKQYQKQQAARMAADSVARAEALRYADSIAAVQGAMPDADSTAAFAEFAGDSTTTGLYKTASLNSSVFNGDEDIVYLENPDLKIGFSTHGGQICEVLIKKYFRYDSTALYLMPMDYSSFDVELDAGQYINTSDFNYTISSESANSVAMRLYVDENSYIENVYTLGTEGYDVGFDMKFVGMDRMIPRSASAFKISWNMDLPRLEKGYANEKNYSSVAFRYAGNDDVKQILMRKDGGRESFAGQTSWVAFKQQFFSAILYAEDNFSSGEVAAKAYQETDLKQRLLAAGAVLNVEYGDKGSEFTKSFQFSFIPNHFPLMKGYGRQYDKLLPLGGWLTGTICKYVIIPVFNWLSKYIRSYGLIILILTLLIKLVISPLTYKSYSSSAKMKVLKPEIDKINAKYPKEQDAMKKQQATMDLYKKSGVSMFGGCLPILLQFPILYAMFRFFPSSLELRQQGFLWADDLSAYDSILDFGFKIPLLGDHLSLFALLMGATMIIYSKMTMSSMDTSQQMPGMSFMQVWFMPIFMMIFCNNVSAGLSYYYMLSNIITIGQNAAIRKWFVDEKKILAQIQRKTAEEKAPKKSKFAQRLEEAYKVQQQQQKNQKRR